MGLAPTTCRPRLPSGRGPSVRSGEASARPPTSAPDVSPQWPEGDPGRPGTRPASAASTSPGPSQDDCKVRFAHYFLDWEGLAPSTPVRTTMGSPTADSLLAAFGRITDPRHRRGVRHPFDSLLARTFHGLL